MHSFSRSRNRMLYESNNNILDLTQCRNIKTAYYTYLANNDDDTITTIIGYKPKNVGEISKFVDSLGHIDILDVSWIDVSELTDLSYCFHGSIAARRIIGLEKWDVSNVEDMSNMFWSSRLERISDITNWDVSNVKNMCLMFAGCNNLVYIGDITYWDVSNVEDMYGMFNGCEKLTDRGLGELEYWCVSSGTDMDEMFRGCRRITLPGWY